MVTPTRKPALWAIVASYVAGAAFIFYNTVDWATSTPSDLAEWSSGRSIALPGWLWITLGYILGVTMLVTATWAVRWRRRWK